MAEVPEHLLKRSQERRKALGLPVPGEEGDDEAAAADAADAPSAADAAEAAPAEAAAARRRDAGDAITEDKGGDPRAPARAVAQAQGRAAPAAAATPRGRRRRRCGRGRGDRRRRTGARPAPAPAVTRSGCSRSSSRARSSRRAPRRRTRCTCGRTCSSIEFAVDPFADAVRHDLLGAGEGAAARPRRLQPDAEPVEGAVVLPRAAGAAHDVPPDGRRCDDPGHRARSCSMVAPFVDKNPSNKPNDRKFAIVDLHDVPDDVGGARHHRFVLPGPGLQLRLPLERRHLLRAVGAASLGYRRRHRRRSLVVAAGDHDLVDRAPLARSATGQLSARRTRDAAVDDRRRRGDDVDVDRARGDRPRARRRDAGDRTAAACRARRGGDAGRVRAGRRRGARRHPPAVLQPGDPRRRRLRASARSAPACSRSCGRRRAAASAARSTSASPMADAKAAIDNKQPVLHRRGATYIVAVPDRHDLAEGEEGRTNPRHRRDGAGHRRAVPEVRAPRLPRAVVPDVAVVRVPVPRLEVQPGRREEGGPGAARPRPLRCPSSTAAT